VFFNYANAWLYFFYIYILIFPVPACYGAKIAGGVIKVKHVTLDFSGVVGELTSKSRYSRPGGDEISHDLQK
jgi:hypothetical protein